LTISLKETAALMITRTLENWRKNKSLSRNSKLRNPIKSTQKANFIYLNATTQIGILPGSDLELLKKQSIISIRLIALVKINST